MMVSSWSWQDGTSAWMPAPVDPEPSAKVHPSMSKRHARMAPPPRKVLAELPADCFEGKNERGKRCKNPGEDKKTTGR